MTPVWRRVEGDDEALVTLRVTGGVAGGDDELTVARSGRVTLTVHRPRRRRPRSGRLDPAQLADLERLVDRTDFETARARAERAGSPVHLADGRTYRITAGDRALSTHDGVAAVAVPPIPDPAGDGDGAAATRPARMAVADPAGPLLRALLAVRQRVDDPRRRGGGR